MLQTFMITLREGLEAFLIVAISLSYLRKTGRGHLVPAVGWGVGSSIVASAITGYLLQRAANQALWEGVFAIVAAILVGTLTVHMWRTAKHLKRDIETRLEKTSTEDQGAAAYAGVFLFTVFMITREGMETALLMNGLLLQEKPGAILGGALLGLLLAGALAWLWSRNGHRINLARFFQVTAIFLFVFLIQLLIYGFHEMTEASVLPWSEDLNDKLHWATEAYGPEGRYGQWLSYALVALPVGWLFGAWLRDGKALTVQESGSVV